MRKNKKIAITISIIIFLLAAFGYGVKKAGENGKFRQNSQKKNSSGQVKNENNLTNWEIPADEILIDLLEEDTNQDGLKEILAVAEKPAEKKACFYIFNNQGEKIYYKESSLLPDRIELRQFDDDDYDSFFLVFEGQFKEGFFIRWNGEEYVIPEEEK